MLAGFQTYNNDVTIRTGVPIQLPIRLEVAAGQTTVTVEGASATLVDNKTTASDTIDRGLLAVLPTLSPDSGLNDAIMLTTPGVVADSNGFFHPLGDHAQVSYVIDGQPVSDQRNKVFSTSIPANAIQSMEVISGSPAAEYGDKTSLVINATTRSGLGQKPTGSLLASYGSFGTVGEEATLGLGNARWGNFLVFNAERSGRFLDTPEFWPDARQGQRRNPVRPHGLSARREGCPPPEPDGVAQLDAGSQHLRSGAAGPKAEGSFVQHCTRLPAHHRRADPGHGQRVSPPRSRRLLSQPGPAQRFSRHPRARPLPDELRRPCRFRARAGTPQLEGRTECRPHASGRRVPARHHRSGLQRARQPGIFEQPAALRPESRRAPLRVSRHGHHRSTRPVRAGLHHPGRADPEHRSALRPLRRTDGRTGRPAARRLLLPDQGDRHGHPRRLHAHHGNSRQ